MWDHDADRIRDLHWLSAAVGGRHSEKNAIVPKRDALGAMGDVSRGGVDGSI